MSATTTVGNYEIGNSPLWDADIEKWYVRIGVKTKKGMDLHYTVHSRNPETLIQKAHRLAMLLTPSKPVNK